MNLLEYQVKQLFREVGIPILPSQKIATPQDIKVLQVPYPVLLKSQVHVGDKEEAGCVRLVENRIDAIAAVRTIFNLPVFGEYPDVILAEAPYQPEQEFLLAIALDSKLQRPVLLGSTQGGRDCDALLTNLQRVVIEEEFSPFYARHLAVKMGLSGQLLTSVSNTIEKMYSLFINKDLNSIEINPLGVKGNGEVIALDGKIAINDYALGRHPDILEMSRSPSLQDKFALETNGLSHSNRLRKANYQWLAPVDSQGNIGIIGNDVGLALGTWDALCQSQGKPACCLVVNAENSYESLTLSTCTKNIQPALEQLLTIPQLKVVLINILASANTIGIWSEAITNYLDAKLAQGAEFAHQKSLKTTTSNHHRHLKKTAVVKIPQLVIRLAVPKGDVVNEQLPTIPVHFTNDLEEALTKTVLLAQQSVN